MSKLSIVNSVTLILCVIIKHPGHIHSQHIAKLGLFLSLKPCALLIASTWCDICFSVCKRSTHLHNTRYICKSSDKIVNALPTKMFKHCASSRTVILWSSSRITATIFHKTSMRPVLGYPSHGSSTTLSQPS